MMVRLEFSLPIFPSASVRLASPWVGLIRKQLGSKTHELRFTDLLRAFYHYLLFSPRWVGVVIYFQPKNIFPLLCPGSPPQKREPKRFPSGYNFFREHHTLLTSRAGGLVVVVVVWVIYVFIRVTSAALYYNRKSYTHRSREPRANTRASILTHIEPLPFPGPFSPLYKKATLDSGSKSIPYVVIFIWNASN